MDGYGLGIPCAPRMSHFPAEETDLGVPLLFLVMSPSYAVVVTVHTLDDNRGASFMLCFNVLFYLRAAANEIDSCLIRCLDEPTACILHSDACALCTVISSSRNI